MALNCKPPFPKDCNRGFTLVETFVAITILLIAVIGPLALVAKSLSDSIFAQNQITAFYLGQEGLELVINKVAENEIANRAESTDWLSGLDDCLGEAGCMIDLSVDNDEEVSEIITERCSQGGCDPLFQDDEGIFGYGLADDETIFVRTIKISDPNEIDTGSETLPIDALVTVTVEWTNRSRPQTFSVSTLIYNYFSDNE